MARSSARAGSASALLMGLTLASATGAAKTIAVSTPQELISAVDKAVPGDIIEVAPGTYPLATPLLLERNGPKVLRGKGLAEEVIISGSGPREVVRVSGSSWSLQRLTLRGNVAVRLEEGATGFRLERSRIIDVRVGIEAGDASDLVCALSGVVLHNNVFALVRDDGILLNSVCDAQIYHQTMWSVRRPLLVQGQSRPPQLCNNIWSDRVFVMGNGDLTLPGPADDTWFVAVDKLDFHLRKGAPPVDQGIDTLLAEDADGKPRKQGRAPDVGAYELAAAGGQGEMMPPAVGGGVVPGAGGGSHSSRVQEGSLRCAASGRGGASAGWALFLVLTLLHSRTRRRARGVRAYDPAISRAHPR